MVFKLSFISMHIFVTYNIHFVKSHPCMNKSSEVNV